MNEREKVLEMLEKGTITAEEANRLLTCLQEDRQKEEEEEKARVSFDEKRMKGKMLRVQVNGDTKEAKNVNVNVSVPLVLARHMDNIIENCVPDSANDELKKNGINLKALNLAKIVDTFETLKEDIVYADIDQDETKIKVRVYVE